MLDSIRHLRLSKEEKRQEAVTAYLDDVLTPKERERFEKQMAAEPALKAEVEAQRQLKRQLGQLPRQAAPRNFTLDPAAYGQPERANALVLYPFLRGATVMAGLLFIVALTAQLLFGSQNLAGLSDLAPEVEMSQEQADESFLVEAERAVSEPSADEPAEEIAVEEAPVSVIESEILVEEEAIEEQEAGAPLEEAEVPVEEELAAEIVVTLEIESEEAEMPAEDSAAAAPAESPALGESEPDRAPAASDGGLDTAEMLPTAPATQQTELVMPAASPDSEQATHQPAATARIQDAESILPPISQVEDTAKASDDVFSGPLQPLQLVSVVLGVIVVILAGITLLTRRRL